MLREVCFKDRRLEGIVKTHDYPEHSWLGTDRNALIYCPNRPQIVLGFDPYVHRGALFDMIVRRGLGWLQWWGN